MTSAPIPTLRTQQEAAGAAGGLFDLHARLVYGICRAMLRDRHEAEDATQQVFLSAYQALLGGAVVREPGSWLATIARNESRARIAAGMRRPLPVSDEDLDALPAHGDEEARRAQLDGLRAALAELPERQREAVVLRYLYGLRYGEVATALGLSRPATEALLFRARRSMRVRLRPVVGAALVVPSVVRDELALALPGFGGSAGAGVAAAGVSGGLLAKLTAGPLGLKAATAVVAVSTVGAVGGVPIEQADAPRSRVAALDAMVDDRLAREEWTSMEHDDDGVDGLRSSSSSSSRSGSSGDERSDRGTEDGRTDDERASSEASSGGSDSRPDEGTTSGGTGTGTGGHGGSGGSETPPGGTGDTGETAGESGPEGSGSSGSDADGSSSGSGSDDHTDSSSSGSSDSGTSGSSGSSGSGSSDSESESSGSGSSGEGSGSSGHDDGEVDAKDD